MRFLKNSLFAVLMLFMVAAMVTTAAAEEKEKDYWTLLLAKADKLYGGWDLKVVLNATADPDGNGKPGVNISVPIYNKDKKIEISDKKMAYLEKGASFIKQIESNSAVIKVLVKKAEYLKTVMPELGVAGIDAYYQVAQDIAVRKVDIDQAKKQLDAMLK